MRYLYADSEPFPLSYDFLATLKAVIGTAATVYERATAIQGLNAEMGRRDGQTQAILQALGEFEGAVSAARAAAAGHFEHIAAVVAYNEKLKGSIEGSGAEARKLWASKNKEGNAEAQKKIDAHHAKMREVLSELTLNAELGMELTYARWTPQEDGSYDLRVGAWTQGPLEVDYGAAVDQVPEWKEPRKIEAIAGDVVFQVGMKKKFLRRDVTRDWLVVNDFVLGPALVHQRGCEAELLRKPGSQKDSVVLRLMKAQGQAHGTIARPSSGGEPFPATPDDVEKLEGLRTSLETAGKAILPKRDSVHGMRLEGRDVFSEHLETQVCDRLIELYTPLVQEIAKRSPSANELSLKLEHDDGRREEIYLRKSELTDQLQPLDQAARAKFEPLGIA